MKKKLEANYNADRIIAQKLTSGKMMMAYCPGQDEMFPDEWVIRSCDGQVRSRANSRKGLINQAAQLKVELRWWKQCVNQFSMKSAIEDRDIIGYGVGAVELESGTMHILIKTDSPTYNRILASMRAKRFLRTK